MSHYLDETTIQRQENRLFFRRWLKHPVRLGTLAPISVRFSKFAASLLNNPKKGPIVEIGAGTGRLTRALLAAGVPNDNLIVVELDPELCRFLKESLPSITVIEGDARLLTTLLPKEWMGKVSSVVSAIPLMYLEPSERQDIVKACFDVMSPGGDLMHITYSPKSPLHFNAALKAERVGQFWLNLPPAFVWRYQSS